MYSLVLVKTFCLYLIYVERYLFDLKNSSMFSTIVDSLHKYNYTSAHSFFICYKVFKVFKNEESLENTSTLYTLHSTLYTLHSTLYTLYSTLYTLHSTLYTLHSTLYTLHSKLYTLKHKLKHKCIS